MEIQLIRNATLKIKYANKTILVDPMLCEKETIPPFMKGLKKNPTVELPTTIETIINDVDAVMVTHSHPDHFDSVSSEMLAENIPIFATPADKDFFSKQNFSNISIVEEQISWQEINVTRIEGQHGSGPVLPHMGEVSEFVLQSENEPTMYIVSDTILVDAVKDAITKYKPKVIVTNSGNGVFPGLEQFPVIMDEKQTVEVAKLASDATIIAVHLESIDFNKATRQSLRNFAAKEGISATQLLIPSDGETVKI